MVFSPELYTEIAEINKFYERIGKNRCEARRNVEVNEEFDNHVLKVLKRGRESQKRAQGETEDNLKRPKLLSRLNRLRSDPYALHYNILYNDSNTNNCGCTDSYYDSVIHHKFIGEEKINQCNPSTNNLDHLYQYFLEVECDAKHQVFKQSKVSYHGKSYLFEGFTLMFHKEVSKEFLQLSFNRILPGYTVRLVDKTYIESYTVKELELFHSYLIEGLFELRDVDRGCSDSSSCPTYHLLPRFVNGEYDNGVLMKRLLPMTVVLRHIIKNFTGEFKQPSRKDSLKDFLVCNPTKKPCCIRVDNDKRETESIIMHFTLRPTREATAAKQKLVAAQRKFKAFKDKLANEKEASEDARNGFKQAFDELKQIKMASSYKRSTTAELNPEGFKPTGLCHDVIQHVVLALAVVFKVRYHWSLDHFEEDIQYKFKRRDFLELAFTHPSYQTQFLTNPEHIKNTLRNTGCVDESTLNSQEEKPKGASSLMEVMAQMGSEVEQESSLHHNERLEFLGDAVVELVVSYHLFFMLPHVAEGVLAAKRSQLVKNAHLGSVGQRMGMHKYLLRTHGVDNCKEESMKKNVANAFEALMGAIFLDSDVKTSDRVLSRAFFGSIPEVYSAWVNPPEHPLKVNSPSDRHWIPKVKWLQKLTELEDYTGIYFHHIRVLAKAFTRRNVGFNNLTQGHNQTLEFLGDTVLQFFTSAYLYKHFPGHHEGHLSLLRSCLVSNKMQSVICDELSLSQYLIDPNANKVTISLSTKDKADLLESFIGAVYVDRGFDFCETLIRICFFPRLPYFILSAKWNDPKSQLQQCCLSLKARASNNIEVPEYKLVSMNGPTNTRQFQIAVYFKGKKLGVGEASTVHDAEMLAAENALIRNAHLFSKFNLESTYMGDQIREYNKEAEEPEVKKIKVEVKPEPISSPECSPKRQSMEAVAISDDSD